MDTAVIKQVTVIVRFVILKMSVMEFKNHAVLIGETIHDSWKQIEIEFLFKGTGYINVQYMSSVVSRCDCVR